MTCIWGDYSYPTMWIDSNGTYGNASYEWINTGTARLVVDGIYDWHCNGNMPSIGGENDMLVQIVDNGLVETRNYRLIWSYNLVPVEPNDLNDLDD